jgi:hypothetical protein
MIYVYSNNYIFWNQANPHKNLANHSLSKYSGYSKEQCLLPAYQNQTSFLVSPSYIVIYKLNLGTVCFLVSVTSLTLLNPASCQNKIDLCECIMSNMD